MLNKNRYKIIYNKSNTQIYYFNGVKYIILIIIPTCLIIIKQLVPTIIKLRNSIMTFA